MSDFLISAALLFIFMGSLLGFISYQETSGLINECEAELPRSQHCVLVAVPAVLDALEGKQDAHD